MAHRDLKTDNILVNFGVGDPVQVVLSDFGCCWANKSYGFECPYPTDDIDKGGNAALMAPEVANAVPGMFSRINYSKADLWAVGTLAFEIFGQDNPFYHGLDSRDYILDDLPMLSEQAPLILHHLVRAMLEIKPSKRLSADEAANICQVLLWAPRSWTQGNFCPSSQDILQWTMTVATKVIYECKFSNSKAANAEYELVLTFLARLTIQKVKKALSWISLHQ